MNLSKHVKISMVQNYLADGAGASNSDSVDMSGFDGVMFVGIIGQQDASATAEIKAQQSTDNAAFNDLSGAVAISPVNSDNKFLVLDVYRPLERYVRSVLTRAGTTNSEWGGTLAIQYMGSKKPTAHDAAKLAAEALSVSPVEV